MIKHGVAPYLECSSKGDTRFSAFRARLVSKNWRTIEELYQSYKIFPSHLSGVDPTTGHMKEWRHAKGRMGLNQADAVLYYDLLWREYIHENPELIQVLVAATGLSDMFGQPGSCLAATSLFKIRNDYITNGYI